MVEHVDGGLTPEDRSWLQRQLAPARVDQQAKPPARRPLWLDQAMPYVPAFLIAWFGALLSYVVCKAVGTPRVWPGVITAFVSSFLFHAYTTWRREKRMAAGRTGGGR